MPRLGRSSSTPSGLIARKRSQAVKWVGHCPAQEPGSGAMPQGTLAGIPDMDHQSTSSVQAGAAVTLPPPAVDPALRLGQTARSRRMPREPLDAPENLLRASVSMGNDRGARHEEEARVRHRTRAALSSTVAREPTFGPVRRAPCPSRCPSRPCSLSPASPRWSIHTSRETAARGSALGRVALRRRATVAHPLRTAPRIRVAPAHVLVSAGRTLASKRLFSPVVAPPHMWCCCVVCCRPAPVAHVPPSGVPLQ
jgi:hypothetical protein